MPGSFRWQRVLKVSFNVPAQKKHHTIQIYGGLGHAIAQEVTGFSLCRAWFNPRPVPLGFMVDKVAL
jgi:hypothetical protein